jgi:hypothetical protein
MAVSKIAQAELPPSSLELQAGPLWRLQRNGRVMDCTVLAGPTGGFEAHIRRDGALCAAGQFEDLAAALAHGHQLRSDLIATSGWQSCKGEIQR